MTSLETCWESFKTQQFFGTDLAYYEKGLFSQNFSAIVSVHQILHSMLLLCLCAAELRRPVSLMTCANWSIQRLPITLSLILQVFPRQAVAFHWELQTVDRPWLIHSERVESWLADALFSPRQKQSEHNKQQSPGGYTDCYSMKES